MEVHCDVCDAVVCVGRDQSDGSMARHIQGKRHQRLLQMKNKVAEKASCSVFVRGVHGNTKLSAAQLKEHFQKFGNIKKVVMDKVKSLYAIIEFDCKDAAQQVLGQSDHRLPGDHKLVVKPREVKMDNFKPARLGNRHDTTKKTQSKDSEVPVVDRKTVLEELRKIQSLDGQMVRLMSLLQLTQEDDQQRQQLCQSLQKQLAVFFPGCTIHQFGSSVNKFGVKGCDMDIFLDLHIDEDDLKSERFLSESESPSNLDTRDRRQIKVYTREELREMTSFDQVKAIRRTIQRHIPECQNVVFVPSQRCPVCRFTFRSSGIKCDVSVSNRLALRNTKFLRLCTELDVRLSPLVYAIRYWAKCRDIAGNIQSGTKLNNYALCLLVVFYLQNLEKPILPSIQQLADYCGPEEKVVIEDWDCSFVEDKSSIPSTANTMTVGELLLGFYQFYAKFDFSTNIICPRTGKTMNLMTVLNPDTMPAKMEGYKVETVAIQDPFVLNHNPAFNINEKMKERIISEFQTAAKMADFLRDNPDHEFSLQGLVMFLSNEIPAQFTSVPPNQSDHLISKLKLAENKHPSKHGTRKHMKSCLETSFEIVLCPAHLSQKCLLRLNETSDFKHAWQQEICQFIYKLLTECLLIPTQLFKNNILQKGSEQNSVLPPGQEDNEVDGRSRWQKKTPDVTERTELSFSAVDSKPNKIVDDTEKVTEMEEFHLNDVTKKQKDADDKDQSGKIEKTAIENLVNEPLSLFSTEGHAIGAALGSGSGTPKRQNSGSEYLSDHQILKKTKSDANLNTDCEVLQNEACAENNCDDYSQLEREVFQSESIKVTDNYSIDGNKVSAEDCLKNLNPKKFDSELVKSQLKTSLKPEERYLFPQHSAIRKQSFDSRITSSPKKPNLFMHLQCSIQHAVWLRRKAVRKNLLHAGHKDDLDLEVKVTQDVIEHERDRGEKIKPFAIDVLLMDDDKQACISQTAVHVVLRAQTDVASHSFSFFSSYISKGIQKYYS
ncbi:speckle targeted PIP5K1A-regulated poly(A) polymerase [Lingula anatina]|uniref:Speckle targeted PIP5K1A-regulated poly(A) polymerase n=1 Tax=Lingula anatina TaxID=7574 RepID=A0A1S3HFN7_LINAN|nr:speckle targeted PIP5K1A-regulated poly(A) polymerase [Lingula anatina]|eukprot:XP_013384286.1 speckle targeted PIP5K1A-regulated poly(A) polymerase [Lingula anatina]